MTYEADVAVIGVGAVGSMTAWRLTERGLSVHAFEQFGVPNHRGASAGQTRRIAPFSLAAPELTPTLTYSRTLWRDLERTSGHQLYVRTGGIILGPADTPDLVRLIRTAEEEGIRHDLLEPDALRARFPQHLVRDCDLGVWDELTGYLRPELGILAAADAARRGGAVIREYTPVTAVHPEDRGVIVETGDERLRFRWAVIAPGAWAEHLLPYRRPTIIPRLNPQAWYAPRDISRYRAPAFAVFERVGDVKCYGFPTIDGATVKIGISTDPHPPIADMKGRYPEVTAERLADFSAVIARFFPGLHPTPVAVAAQPEGYSVDGHPFVGRLPDSPQVIAACGFSGAGYKSSPVTGEWIADLVAHGQSPWQLSRFDPKRSLTTGGAP
ncbi:FAD-dependent oxidoreductase [Occultella glacieicola]|uniref:FAD-dependent oxidoreductase n=1 Tax=Occultella glacieicola TaxID=2518684 RepID=A0ABY2E0G3_9MICO|nr:FAD-dependent oxidoreductase [Occultella glacieicola]TDE88546.1 FAD-dependent oxidoreductase [Occultella glacieicola]